MARRFLNSVSRRGGTTIEKVMISSGVTAPELPICFIVKGELIASSADFLIFRYAGFPTVTLGNSLDEICPVVLSKKA